MLRNQLTETQIRFQEKSFIPRKTLELKSYKLHWTLRACWTVILGSVSTPPNT